MLVTPKTVIVRVGLFWSAQLARLDPERSSFFCNNVICTYLLILRCYIIVPYCAETMVLAIYIDHFVRFSCVVPGVRIVVLCSLAHLPHVFPVADPPTQTASRKVHSADPTLFPASAFTPTGVSDRVGSISLVAILTKCHSCGPLSSVAVPFSADASYVPVQPIVSACTT